MFFQVGEINESYPEEQDGRIRIFYPDGKVEWCWLWQPKDPTVNVEMYNFDEKPCWLKSYKEDSSRSYKIATAMNFDSREGFKPMKFLGYL